ncbi:hypothetical protein [Sinomonas humi]|uniref:hypothetical protein n=1 Tax=Sinomonas humi TaxID=1338436 RepID=UPI0006914EAD|nr:hypothetical protein [Sinomonas humi]
MTETLPPLERAQQAFKELGLGTEVSLDSLIAHVQRLRGRPILIEERPELVTTTTCGLWFSTDELEIVFHREPQSELHRQQFILHELAHMVLRHNEGLVSADYAKTLFPDLDGERVRSALARDEFDREDEIVAELLADLLSAAIHTSDREYAGYSEVFG